MEEYLNKHELDLTIPGVNDIPPEQLQAEIDEARDIVELQRLAKKYLHQIVFEYNGEPSVALIASKNNPTLKEMRNAIAESEFGNKEDYEAALSSDFRIVGCWEMPVLDVVELNIKYEDKVPF